MAKRDLWEGVREARARLEEPADYPVLASLCECWEAVQEFSVGFFVRDELDSLSDTPLAALMFCIEMGVYPPPELLLGVKASWMEYLYGEAASLEEAFLGKPKQRAGNYARRRARSSRDSRIMFDFRIHIRQGMTQVEAATAVIAEHDLAIDVDAVIKIATTRPKK